LNDAKTQIAKIEKPSWYILDRNSNYGYAEYIQDTDRVANLAKAFPIVFFLVAALISLTSMSRMIEEQRVQIGTLKALGYNKIQISFKYLIYAFLATMIGGVVGMIIGFKLIPSIIIMMYEMMYTIPKADCIIRIEMGVMGLGFALVCTLGATIYTCIKELKEKPAELMLPKAPKPGKRIILEKITFIWKRLKFTNKVTARNVFRYKKKMLMTVVGVAGCTSLIIAGFGIRNAIGNMIPNQYGEIFKYDGTIEFKEDVTKTQIQEENEKVKNLDKIADTLPSYMKTVEITSIQNSQTINLVVPEQSDKLDEFIGLRNRKHKKETYTLDDNSVIISEKIASLLKIKVGDTITIKNTDDIEKDVKVGAITENYIYHYMYMSSNLYNKLYGENSFKPNTLLIKEAEGTTEDDEDNIGKTILQDDTTVAGVSFLSGTKDIFVTVMEQMQLVVYVLIISAGLLAFAVLYNLSNVNISERIRELATIKVLGFYNKEVFNYITKETRILTVIGIFFGLFGGYFLSMYAVKTCELDMMMFNYEISKMCFIYGIIITIMFAEIVNLAVNRTLKKISMTESLKSVDWKIITILTFSNKEGNMAYIEFKNVVKEYTMGDNKIRALDNANFEINKGELVVIVGPSGAGKTTALNVLGGMDSVTSGDVVIDGRHVNNYNEKQLTKYRREDIGFVFQFYNLVQNLTAIENVELATQICKHPLSPEKVMEKVGLQERKNNFPSQLSGGEQQRVAIARAIAKNPKILLCDEPTGALDYNTGKQILKLLQDTCRKENMTVIIITHNSAIAPMADKIIHFKNGKSEDIVINKNPTPIEEIEW